MFARFAALAALPLLAFAQSEIAGNGTGIDKNGKYAISSEGIKANFIAYGASVSNLFIEDIHGEIRDVVLGFDNASYYGIDKQHNHLGGVPGRYANRIMNSTFEIDGQVYETDPNEHGGLNTLHGGCE
jgi:aldose 1-epimerase